jgi:hypothetical protein
VGILDRFFVALGFQVDTEGIDKFEAKTEELRAGILRLGALFTGAAVGVGLFIEKQVSGMTELKHFADLNQLTAEQVAAWNRVAAINLVSQEDAQASLGMLNRRLGEAAIGLGRGMMIFRRLGLSAKDSAGHVKSLDSILGDVAEKMRKSGSRAENLAMAARLGIDPKLVPMLEKGQQEYRKLRDEAAKTLPLTEEDYRRADELNLQFIKAKFTLLYFVQLLAAKLMPVVNRVLDAYLTWFNQMRTGQTGFVIKTFKLLSGVMESIWGWILRIITEGSKFTAWLSKSKVAVGLLTTAVALLISYKVGSWIIGVTSAINTLITAMTGLKLATAGPVMLLGLLALTIALLIDDIVGFYEGNDSVIGQLNEKFPGAIYVAEAAVLALSAAMIAMKLKAIIGLIDTIRLVIMYTYDWAAALWTAAAANIAATWEIALIVIAILALIGIIYMLWKYWDQYAADIKRWWHDITDSVGGFIDKIKEAISWVKTLASQMSAKDWMKLGIASFAGPVTGGLELASIARQHPSAFQSSVIGSAGQTWNQQRSTTVVSRVDNPVINVYSTDPDRAGQDVIDELNKLHRGATRDAQGAVGL